MSDCYTKKPITIHAMQYTVDNEGEVIAWAYKLGGEPMIASGGNHITIKTLEGPMIATAGDWVIQGVKGEFYPCKPDIFELTYEPAILFPAVAL